MGFRLTACGLLEKGADVPEPTNSQLSSEEVADLVEGHDPLLDRALERVRKERNSAPRAFFKHGSHGSHNSG